MTDANRTATNRTATNHRETDGASTAPTADPTGAPLPLDRGWRHDGTADAFTVTAESALVAAPAGADLFHAADATGHRRADVPALRRAVAGDFTVRSHLTVSGGRFADAGGLCLYGPDGWFKLCLERTRQGGWAAVSVLSRPDSDEASGPPLPGPSATLLLTRQGHRFAAFVHADDHADRDWVFVRTFAGWHEHVLELGLFAQAPFSEGSAATFSSVRLGGRALRDRR